MAIESDVAAHLHPDFVNDPNIGLTLQGAEKNALSRQRQVVGRGEILCSQKPTSSTVNSCGTRWSPTQHTRSTVQVLGPSHATLSVLPENRGRGPPFLALQRTRREREAGARRRGSTNWQVPTTSDHPVLSLVEHQCWDRSREAPESGSSLRIFRPGW